MCHQAVGLTARHLEEAGIPTLVIGSARDILDEIGVPRYAFTDLPLGNPIGPADDSAQQLRLLKAALEFAQAATLPRSSVLLPVEWHGPADWRDTYMALDDRDGLAAAGEARRAQQQARKPN